MRISRIKVGILVFLFIKWISLSHAVEVDSSIAEAIHLLEQTPSGRAQLEKARAEQFPILAGEVSKTEITITRTEASGKDQFKFVIQVRVARNKKPLFQALDLAHELVHALNPKLNPFDPTLKPEDYIIQGIEGSGGEAQAIEEECRTGKALAQLNPEFLGPVEERCQSVWSLQAHEQQWKHTFYFLGPYYEEFLDKINLFTQSSDLSWEKKIEIKSPLFSSAVAHKPYPLALLEEYVSMTKLICNSSSKDSTKARERKRTMLERRCQAISAK